MLAGLKAPGVEVIESMSPTPSVILSVPYFEIEVEHDLLPHADVFGLLSATDTSRGHFPGLSPEPLAVSQAKQAVLARFRQRGSKRPPSPQWPSWRVRRRPGAPRRCSSCSIGRLRSSRCTGRRGFRWWPAGLRSRRTSQLLTSLHKGEAEQVEPTPLRRVPGAVVGRGQADAPDAVDRTGLDQHP